MTHKRVGRDRGWLCIRVPPEHLFGVGLEFGMLAHAVVGYDLGGLGLFQYVPGNHDGGHETGYTTENTGNNCDQHGLRLAQKTLFVKVRLEG